jgi:hypothetical protein
MNRARKASKPYTPLGKVTPLGRPKTRLTGVFGGGAILPPHIPGIPRQFLYSYLTPTEIINALARGKVAEAAGKRDVAVKSYLLVIRAWARGDPEVQGHVQEAQAGIRRLGGS